MVCCCCCLEILSNLIFELGFVCEVRWSGTTVGCAEEKCWAAVYQHAGSGVRDMCALSGWLGCPVPRPSLGHREVLRWQAGRAWVQTGGGECTSDSETGSSCGARGHSPGEGKGSMRARQGLWCKAGLSVSSCSIATDNNTVN